METKQYQEMESTIVELRDFSRNASRLAEKIQAIRASTVNWQVKEDDAKRKAETAMAELERAKAENMLRVQELPNELAPLRRRLDEDARRLSILLAEAERAKQEAEKKLTRANDLYEAAGGKSEKSLESKEALVKRR